MKHVYPLKAIFTAVLFITVSAVSAQFNLKKYEDIQKLKKIPLLVVMETPKQKTIKKLEKKDPEGLKTYLAEVQGKNDVLKNGLQKNWKASKELKFITKDELDTYQTKENAGKYAYMTADIYDKVRAKKSESGYLIYCNYSVFIIGDVMPVHSLRYSSEYTSTLLDEKVLQIVCAEMQSELKNHEDLVKNRRAKRELKKRSSWAKSTYSDEIQE